MFGIQFLHKTIGTLRWRHNDHDGVSNHQPYHCLLNCLFGRRSKETSKLRVTGLRVGNSPGTGEFPAQMASNAENVSIWWRRHVFPILQQSAGAVRYVNQSGGQTYVAAPGTVILQPAVTGGTHHVTYPAQQWPSGQGPPPTGPGYVPQGPPAYQKEPPKQGKSLSVRTSITSWLLENS